MGHVGDSRVYRLRKDRLDQLTFDHSLVWEMMAAGQMPRGEVASFIPKNIITRSLGPHADVQIDLEGPFPLQVGDTFMICSDGLTGQVRDEEIGPILSTLSPQEAVRVLVDMANLRGGPDNITAIVVRVLAVPAEDAQQAETPVRAAGRRPRIACRRLERHGDRHAGRGGALRCATVDRCHGGRPGGLGRGRVGVVAECAECPDILCRWSAAGRWARVRTQLRDAVPNAETTAVLAQMGLQLREAARDEHWTLDWARFNAFGERARVAVAAGDYSCAVREYALAISFMMSEIRRQPARKDKRDRSVLDL